MRIILTFMDGGSFAFTPDETGGHPDLLENFAELGVGKWVTLRGQPRQVAGLDYDFTGSAAAD